MLTLFQVLGNDKAIKHTLFTFALTTLMLSCTHAEPANSHLDAPEELESSDDEDFYVDGSKVGPATCSELNAYKADCGAQYHPHRCRVRKDGEDNYDPRLHGIGNNLCRAVIHAKINICEQGSELENHAIQCIHTPGALSHDVETGPCDVRVFCAQVLDPHVCWITSQAGSPQFVTEANNRCLAEAKVSQEVCQADLDVDTYELICEQRR